MTTTPATLDTEQRQALLAIARETIGVALRTGRRLLPDPATLPVSLRRSAATFVTLRRDGRLLGCIGTLQAHQPIGVDVAEHALAAAFDDPRLPAVGPDDFRYMSIEISVLGERTPVPATGYDDLIGRVRPGRDGLLVSTGWRRATLLPAVWESLPTASEFVAALWQKAGLRPREWPADIGVERYEAIEFGTGDSLRT